ncbi:hypothetical protein TNCT_617501 [Trichonephila clavata]|uniref:Reverse transcriptase/retrotransposon-derived protein RNase H-like domain-containing protein n=1 Tax=Trichonephila clavata TaxID=2740835 RepID=A0A8X6GNS4_TRICU|nr:hypothetical protein TNCT_617501 [Trichonephila clavata]
MSSRISLTWTEESCKAFKDLKEALCRAPMLIPPSDQATICLTCHASDADNGADQIEHGMMHPLCFFSRSLKDTQIRHSAYHREILSIYTATKHFRHISEYHLYGPQTYHFRLSTKYRQSFTKTTTSVQLYCSIFN